MIIQNKTIRIIYRSIIMTISGIGVLLLTSINPKNEPFDIIIYYTGISNLICFIISICMLVDEYKDNKKDKRIIDFRIKGIVVMMITVTLLIYHFLLLPKNLAEKGAIETWTWQNIITHYLVPLLVIFDWILFEEKGKYGKKEPFLWLIIPYTYFVYAIIRAELFGQIKGIDSRYPYFFIDIDALGIINVLKYVIIITIFFIILGYIIYFIDRKLAEKIKNR